MVAAAIFYAMICSMVSTAEKKQLDKPIRNAHGCSLDLVQVVGDRRVVVKLHQCWTMSPTQFMQRVLLN